VDKEDGGQVGGGEYDSSKQDAVTIMDSFVTMLVQVSDCQKHWKVVQYEHTSTMASKI
jgi:hypothetical protein